MHPPESYQILCAVTVVQAYFSTHPRITPFCETLCQSELPEQDWHKVSLDDNKKHKEY